MTYKFPTRVFNRQADRIGGCLYSNLLLFRHRANQSKEQQHRTNGIPPLPLLGLSLNQPFVHCVHNDRWAGLLLSCLMCGNKNVVCSNLSEVHILSCLANQERRADTESMTVKITCVRSTSALFVIKLVQKECLSQIKETYCKKKLLDLFSIKDA